MCLKETPSNTSLTPCRKLFFCFYFEVLCFSLSGTSNSPYAHEAYISNDPLADMILTLFLY